MKESDELSGAIRQPDEYVEWLARETTEKLYSIALKLQIALHHSTTRALLSGLDEWTRARSVLDAGCGPGTFAEYLHELLVGKRYLGVDLKPEFTDEARARVQDPSIEFRNLDLFQLK